MSRRIFFALPALGPSGGAVKVFDYVSHALALDWGAAVVSTSAYRTNNPLFEKPGLKSLSERGVSYEHPDHLKLGLDDLYFFSWPMDFRHVERHLGRTVRCNQIIHIIQGIRHASVWFTEGYALRLLSRPMGRIATSHIVLDAIKPHMNASGPCQVILLGHDTGFFSKARSGALTRTIRVAYTTWKSKVAVSVEGRLRSDSRFVFKSLRKPTPWPALRKLYHWADVFLCCPLAEEGFYLPGLEAMAAGCLVITPNAGGNMAYCDFGRNCLEVGFENDVDYVLALKQLAQAPAAEIEGLRRAGYETVGRHRLDEERAAFRQFIQKMADWKM